ERQVEAVAASRSRLLVAEEEERRALAERLDRGAGAALSDVERLVGDADGSHDAALAAALDRARERLSRVRPELEALVRGLGGPDAAGLAAAIEQLATGLPLTVELDLAEVAMSPSVAATVWFVCAESLANAVKHAEAGTVRLSLEG